MSQTARALQEHQAGQTVAVDAFLAEVERKPRA
jgi:hypothetical protein